MAAIYAPDSDAVRVQMLDKNPDGAKTVEQGGEGGKDGERATWGSQKEYLLAAIGYCVGVGNVFRFPYVCNQNGGGAFLLPFITCLLLIGMPMFFLEAGMGQFSGKSPLKAWSICPLLKGIGVSMGVLAAAVYWYFTIILAWSVYYLVSSFQAVLPWTRCDQWWNTPNCRAFDFDGPRGNDMSPTEANVTSYLGGNMTSSNGSVTSAHGDRPAWFDMNVTSLVGDRTSWPDNMTSLNSTGSNGTLGDQVGVGKIVTAAEEFWQHNALQISGSLYESGSVVWYLALAQAAVVIFTFLALLKGIKTSGKVVYVTATAPYVLLTVLLIRSVTLPGAEEGLLFYITPDFRKLADYNIWIQAALQVFYSLAIAWGPNQTLASFNRFNNNILRDCVLISLVGEGTSIYAGFAVFSVLGYLAHQSSVPVNEVVSSGPGLAFVVYPEALSLMPLSQLWAVLFFIMLVTVVLDTQLATGETLFTILGDQFPRVLLRHGVLVRGIISAIVLLLTLPLATQGGVYVFQLVDWYLGSYTPTLVALLECLVIGWLYGADRFSEDVFLMIGRKPPVVMKIMWCFVLPVFFVIMLVITLSQYEIPTYGDYHYDTLAAGIGWMIGTIPFVPIPAVALYQLFKAKGSLLQRIRQTTKPGQEWGPSDSSLFPIYKAKMASRLQRQNCLDVIRN